MGNLCNTIYPQLLLTGKSLMMVMEVDQLMQKELLLLRTLAMLQARKVLEFDRCDYS